MYNSNLHWDAFLLGREDEKRPCECVSKSKRGKERKKETKESRISIHLLSFIRFTLHLSLILSSITHTRGEKERKKEEEEGGKNQMLLTDLNFSAHQVIDSGTLSEEHLK